MRVVRPAWRCVDPSSKQELYLRNQDHDSITFAQAPPRNPATNPGGSIFCGIHLRASARERRLSHEHQINRLSRSSRSSPAGPGHALQKPFCGFMSWRFHTSRGPYRRSVTRRSRLLKRAVPAWRGNHPHRLKPPTLAPSTPASPPTARVISGAFQAEHAGAPDQSAGSSAPP